MRRALFLCLALLLLAPSGAMAVTVERAELRSGQLRLEGRSAAAGAQVRVTAIPATHAATANADSSGEFRVEASGFRSDTCRVTVSDGGRTPDAEAALSGCTPVSSPSPPPPPPEEEPPPAEEPPPPPPPATTCTLNPQEPSTTNVGTLTTLYFTTTGCRTSEKPVDCKVVAGRAPPGLSMTTQSRGTCRFTGRPTSAGIYRFTLEAKDQTGARDTEAYQITVDPPKPVVITNPTDALSAGTVGEFYCCGNLFADGGVPEYTWTLRAGQLPPGLSLSASPGSITGTPTTRGTFSFLVRATDTRGAFDERTFSITIS